MIRNRHMVDLAGIVFGFWSGKGGTAVKTLKYALRQRREVHAVPVFLPNERHRNGEESVSSGVLI
jgi:hypothetical protein